MKCCVHCFTNHFIQAVIREQNEIGSCSYCNMNNEEEEAFVSDMDIVGELIRGKLGLAYKNASTDDVPYDVLSGISTTIEDVLRYSEDIFSLDLDDTGDIPIFIEELFKSSGPSYRDIAQGDFDEWEGGDAEIIMIDEFYVGRNDNHLRYHWDEFTYLVKHVNRFFDIAGSREEMLDTFKELLEQMEYTLPKESLIWRARTNPIIISNDKTIMQYECGSPPRNLARPLRMNPAGISYFYGSADRDTCKQEIRPKVDDKIVYGLFSTKKDLRIIDLSKVPEIHAKSIFDPEYDHSMNWATMFLEGFVMEISKPIEEGDAPIEYVPTQILSEYIRKLGYDGLSFNSCITEQLNYTMYCGRDEQKTEPAGFPWRKFSHANQVPEFTEWMELMSFDLEN